MPSTKTYQLVLPVFIVLIILAISLGTVYLTLENAKTARLLIKNSADGPKALNLSYLGAEESRLTHQNREMGLKFQYPKDWTVTASSANYIYLKDFRGAALAISLPALGGDFCRADNAYESTEITIPKNIVGQKYNCLGGANVYFQKDNKNGIIILTYPAYISSIHYPTLFDEILETFFFE